MNQCEETEEGVHPSETPLCGQHDNQTKAQRLDSLESLSSDLKKASFRSSDSRCVSRKEMQCSCHRDIDFKKKISLERKVSSKYKRVSCKRTKTFNRTAIKKKLGSLESLSSDLKKASFRSSDSRCVSSNEMQRSCHHDIDFKKKLDSLESLSSDSGKDSFQSSDSRCVSRNEMQCSCHRDIDFKKNPDHKSSFRPVSAPPRPDFSESPFSHPLKDVAAGDRYSVLSSDSGLGSLESLSSDLKKASFRFSDSRCVSRNEMQRSCHRDIDFKKNPDHKCALRTASAPTRPDFSEADGDSVLSSDSGISLERKVSSGSSCESGKKEKEKKLHPGVCCWKQCWDRNIVYAPTSGCPD